MKKIFYVFLPILVYATSLKAQTVIVSGQCIMGTITLKSIGDVNGKPAYEDTGTVQGVSGIQIDVYWLSAPDNLWVLAFSGQPYFQNTCNITTPPPTGESCVWAAVPGQTCTGANPLLIAGTGTLAVKIAGFTASKKDNGVVLNWQTATELNNKGFDIQRSPDAINWNKIGFVNGGINSSIERRYRFNDAHPLSGQNFYRLIQLDLDNKATYSSIVSVKVLSSGFYSISNNPGSGLYRLHIEPITEKINYFVIDADGRKIMSKIYNGLGDEIIDISHYASGIYLLRIQVGNNVFNERLIKL
ncbi:MAG: T9SS type A sorting domain-containing protein [Ginsengibacter sp.]